MAGAGGFSPNSWTSQILAILTEPGPMASEAIDFFPSPSCQYQVDPPRRVTMENYTEWVFEQNWSDRKAMLTCGADSVSMYKSFEGTGFLDTNLLPEKPTEDVANELPEEGLLLGAIEDEAAETSAQAIVVATREPVFKTPTKRPGTGAATPQGAKKFRPHGDGIIAATPPGGMALA